MGALIGQQSILEADEGTTVGIDVRTVEVGSKCSSVDSLGVGVDEVNVVDCHTSIVVRLLGVDDGGLLVSASGGEFTSGKLNFDQVLRVIVLERCLSNENDLSLPVDAQLLDVSTSLDVDGVSLFICGNSSNSRRDIVVITATSFSL